MATKKPALPGGEDIFNSPAMWDFLYGTNAGPTVKVDFEGDEHAWAQLKMKAVEHGLHPDDMLRFALYMYLEGDGNFAAARARFLAHKEWKRRRPVLVYDENGIRWASADRLIGELTIKQ